MVFLLAADAAFENFRSGVNCYVETVNGNVYLSGKVKNVEDEQTAISIAKDTSHVESVTSFLTVKHKK